MQLHTCWIGGILGELCCVQMMMYLSLVLTEFVVLLCSHNIAVQWLDQPQVSTHINEYTF